MCWALVDKIINFLVYKMLEKQFKKNQFAHFFFIRMNTEKLKFLHLKD